MRVLTFTLGLIGFALDGVALVRFVLSPLPVPTWLRAVSGDLDRDFEAHTVAWSEAVGL